MTATGEEVLGTPQGEDDESGLGFNDLLLIAVIVLMLAGAAMTGALYIIPRAHLEIPEIQPAVRVAR